MQPVGPGAARPVPVSHGRGVPVRPAGRPVRDQQRGQEVRGRQRAAVRGAQVLPAAAGAADQQAVRPERQPGQVQRHVDHLDVLMTASTARPYAVRPKHAAACTDCSPLPVPLSLIS